MSSEVTCRHLDLQNHAACAVLTGVLRDRDRLRDVDSMSSTTTRPAADGLSIAR